jgi:hypothetical protein
VNFVYENPEIEQTLTRSNEFDDLEDALKRLAELVPDFLGPENRGRRMFCPGLDAAAPWLTRLLKLEDRPGERSNDNVCILATRFYGVGGHSKVASDISRLIGAERTTIVFTDLYRQLRPRDLVHGGLDASYAHRALMLLSAPTMLEKMIELYNLLAALKPTRIFLMGNHMDMVAVAGAWPFRSIVDYIHHADHMPTLGATLPWAAHADLTYTCHLACEAAGLHPLYSAMSLGKLAHAEPRRSPGAARRFATCGAMHKYRQPARHRWVDFVIPALRRPDAEFIHIGPFDEVFVAEVHGPLAEAGVDPDRYRFVGVLPDLRQALVEHETDVYLASYPDSGGRANLEAMAAGLAPIIPVAEDLPPLMHFDLPLESWVRITDPARMDAAIDRSLVLSAELGGPAPRRALAAEFNRFEAFVTSPDQAPRT